MAAPTVTSVSLTFQPTVGSSSITITGTNFTGTCTVTIGGVAATSVVVNSTTSITCLVPAGSAGAASVIVTNGDPASNAANTLVYYVAAVPADIYVYLSGGRGDGHVPNWTGVITEVTESEAGEHYRDIFPSTSVDPTYGTYFIVGVPNYYNSGGTARKYYPTEGTAPPTSAATSAGVSKLSDEVAHTAPRGWTKSVTWLHFLSSSGLYYKFKKSLIIGIGDEARSE